MVDFGGTTGMVCFRRTMAMLGRPTNVVGGICGLKTKNDSGGGRH